MPGIEFLKDWDAKKNGWPALLVAVIFTAYELLAPKDQSCTQNVSYLQSEVIVLHKTIDKKDSVNTDLMEKIFEKNNIISDYNHAYAPYKPVLKKEKR